MSRRLIFVALLALLATDAVVKVEAQVAVATAIVTAAGMLYSMFSGGACGGLFGGATKCDCRNMYLVLESGSQDKVHPGPRLHYISSKTQFLGGQLCQSGTNVIFPMNGTNDAGTSGGIQIGNKGSTYMTGAEAYMYYQLYSNDGRKGYDCYVKVWLNNPYLGSNKYSAAQEGSACPSNLKIELGQYIKGEADAVVQYFVYLETAAVGPAPVPNVMALLGEHKDKGFGILLSILKASDPKLQKQLLNPKAQMTVFAPSDSAFRHLMKTSNMSLAELVNGIDLEAVIQYHVIGGKAYTFKSLAASKALKVQTLLPGANGMLSFAQMHSPKASIITTSNPPVVAKFITRDIPVGSTIVHVLNKVLLPGR